MEPTSTRRQVPFYAGRYRCEEYLGGGMADVYRARDTELPRDVAIKILKPENENDPEVRASFLDEVQLASCCTHENIVATYDKGEFEGSPFIVMEFLRGENLDRLIREHRQGGLKRILLIALQLARAMEFVHSKNIVHRDLKPQNIHVDQNNRLKLVDFGIAKAADWNKTQVGFMKGTAHYMSPEQICGSPVTFSTDIWSFGVVLYETLCNGQRPFQADTLDSLWVTIVNSTPAAQPLVDNGVPDAVQQIVRRCLQKIPADRFPSFAPIVNALEQSLDDFSGRSQMAVAVPTGINPVQMKRVTLWLVSGAIGIALISIVLLAFHLISDKPPVKPGGLVKQLKFASGDMQLVDAGPTLLGHEKRQVNLPAFYIDRTEVTNAAYGQFIKEKLWRKPKDFPSDKPDYPVINVTFYDALQFAKWAGKRLPESEEWEKAARGVRGQLFPWGDTPDLKLANFADNPKITAHALMPVLAFVQGASPYGALNMLGNAWEWVDTDQKPAPEFLRRMQRELDRKLTREDAFYSIRGGDYNQLLSADLTSESASFPARLSAPSIGFRCAKTPDVR